MDLEALKAMRAKLREDIKQGRDQLMRMDGAVLLLNDLIEQAKHVEEPDPPSEE